VATSTKVPAGRMRRTAAGNRSRRARSCARSRTFAGRMPVIRKPERTKKDIYTDKPPLKQSQARLCAAITRSTAIARALRYLA